ncbi:histone-lysine N-methyltransferase EHMT1-like [Haliotis rubra]|uniref:histone-lysine N-methyltransferase EHMT1-like n=1 Tax=Haliotis rubra TaxID=36100 RepID=UPI001EE5C47C|nr:histone-lysine N-methyltransferase EHMT1-like [Haliotis rubra]
MSQVDNDGKNMLQWACKGGHVGMEECLLPQYGVEIKNGYRPPLLQAAWRGHRDVCEFLVCMGANVSQVDDDAYNALHWGCQSGHLDVVKYLLSLCSLDINSRGQGGETPLMKAAFRGHRVVFEFLVRKGANVSQADDDGNNVLHYSSLGGHLEIVKHVIRENMVNLKDRNKDGVTAAMMTTYVNTSSYRRL